jgi:hypothetical protein
MGRPFRVEYPGAVYHITSRGNEKRAIFLENEDRVKLLERLGGGGDVVFEIALNESRVNLLRR